MSKTLEAVAKKSAPIPHITKERLQKLHERRGQLLPIEAQAQAQIDTLISIGRVALRYPEAKILDKSVLRWRWPFHSLRAHHIFRVPLPKLALINISSPKFFLKRIEGSRQDTSIMPSGIPGECYEDILRRLDWSTAFVKSSTLSFTWQGLIPEASVHAINEAEEFFGSYSNSLRPGNPRIYLLAEAPHDLWSMESEAKEPRRVIDPLIVGHKGDHLFVIDSFDPTPLEQYVASEFTT